MQQTHLEKIAKLPKKPLSLRSKNAFILAPLLMADFLLISFVAYHLAYWNRIFPGIFIAQQSVGNLSPSQAIQLIGRRLDIIDPKVLMLTHHEKQWELNLSEIDFSYLPVETVQKAYRTGRSNDFVQDVRTKIKSWQHGSYLTMQYTLNQDLLKTTIAGIAGQIFIPTSLPSINIVNQQIEIEPGREGQELDTQKLITIIRHRLSSVDFNPIIMPITYSPSALIPEQIENTRQRAEKLIGKRLIITGAEKEWQLQQEELVQLLAFTGGFDQIKIADWSANLATAIDRPAENAAFQFTQGQVTEFRPAKEGKILNQKETGYLITQKLTELETASEATFDLPIITSQPMIKTADVNSLGIEQLIGQGVSYFRGSIASRIHNIQLASLKLNGTLIAPGEVFSFNKSLGDISKATGYKEAYIIQGGRTILGDGGGVCQVSTTLFRAVLNSGLPIIERQAHAYRVSYYEQGSSPGIDATVFAPTVDFRFRNDTPAYILIQTNVNPQEGKLTFDLYGSADGRKTTISKSRIWGQIPPPPDLYQDDPTLPIGTVKQIDWQAWGAKVAFDYKVERNGEILQERTFYSAYRPWQAVYLRGTKPN